MERNKQALIASIIGIVGNIFLLIIKAIIGIFSNSQAMLSDALNSAGDIISSFMSYIGSKISSKEADDDHNLGHGKAEYVFSLLISIVMIVFSFEVLINSVKSLFITYDYKFSWYLIIVCIITIAIKFTLFVYTRKIAKKYKNLLIDANSKDHRNDCILTTLNLIASLFGMYGITYVDGIVGSIVSIWILIVGIKLFKEAYDVLMDKGLSLEDQQKILDIVSKYPEIKKINHFNSTPIGYQYQVSLTIFVDGNLSTFKSHDIANKLEKEISSLDEIYLTVIHVNPYGKEKRQNKR